jgi:hypothetical protein
MKVFYYSKKHEKTFVPLIKTLMTNGSYEKVHFTPKLGLLG